MNTTIVLSMIWGGVCGYISSKYDYSFPKMFLLCFAGSTVIYIFCKVIGV